MSATATFDTKKKAGKRAVPVLSIKAKSEPLFSQNVEEIPSPTIKPVDAPFPGHDFSQMPVYAISSVKSNIAESCPLKSGPTRCPYGGACHNCPPRLPAKLAISQPGDEYERKADRVTDIVLRMPKPNEDEGKKYVPPSCSAIVQRRPWGNKASREAEPLPPIVREVLHSPGQSLDTDIRAFMECRFGHDFSHVRLHTDIRAAESARKVEALAYTVGQNIVFGAGRYAPATREGSQLLAHELVHTLQQGEIGLTEGTHIPVTHVQDSNEHEADRLAAEVSQTLNSGELATLATVPISSCNSSAIQPMSSGTPSGDKAANLIKKHRSFWGLNEESLGKELLGILPGKSNLVGQVLAELPSRNKDDVSLAILEAAKDEQIKSIALDSGGKALLLRMVLELESGPTFPDESRQIQRAMKLVTEAAPMKVQEPGKEPRREVEVITFRTGSMDWIGGIFGAKGHTAIIVGGLVYSFEYDWRCGVTKEQYMTRDENMRREGVGQVLDLTEKDAKRIQDNLNRSCSRGLFFISGDVCTDATGKILADVISGLKPGRDPQAFEKQLDATGIVRRKIPYPKKQLDAEGIVKKKTGYPIMPQVDVPEKAETIEGAAKEDKNVKELKDKVSKLVKDNFSGDYKRAFEHYDSNKDTGVDKDELTRLLADAGVGNKLTRSRWVEGIMKKLDTNKDGKIQWSEFESVTK